MVDQVLALFELEAQNNFEIMKENQSLIHSLFNFRWIKKEFLKNRPDLVLVQGDTSTAFASALSAFYEKVPIGHIEAGLRTENLNDPYPEEGNRRLISQIASIHFAPTRQSELNLIKSSVQGIIEVTGNTVIDSLLGFPQKNFVQK